MSSYRKSFRRGHSIKRLALDCSFPIASKVMTLYSAIVKIKKYCTYSTCFNVLNSGSALYLACVIWKNDKNPTKWNCQKSNFCLCDMTLKDCLNTFKQKSLTHRQERVKQSSSHTYNTDHRCRHLQHHYS